MTPDNETGIEADLADQSGDAAYGSGDADPEKAKATIQRLDRRSSNARLTRSVQRTVRAESPFARRRPGLRKKARETALSLRIV